MWRVILVFAVALVVGNATGILDTCDATCFDDDGGKQCPPSCPTCTCPGHAVPTMLSVQMAAAITPVSTHVIEMQSPTVVRGRQAPEPVTRPPIVWS